MLNPALASTFDLASYYKDEWLEHIHVASDTYDEMYNQFEAWVTISSEALQNKGKLLFFGNGGSAADAQHLATELTVRFKSNRQAIPALALTTDTSALTAIGNDFGFEYLFSRQIEALGNPGDIAIGISTSGKSPNVIKAFETAKQMGLMTVGLTGRSGGQLPPLTDVLIKIPSHTVSRIQEMHITLGQMFCGAIEHKLGLI